MQSIVPTTTTKSPITNDQLFVQTMSWRWGFCKNVLCANLIDKRPAL